MVHVVRDGRNTDETDIDCVFSRFSGAKGHEYFTARQFIYIWCAVDKIFVTFVRRISYHRNSVHEVLNEQVPIMARLVHDQRTSNIDFAQAKRAGVALEISR